MKKKYSIAVTLPLTFWVEVEADDDQQALGRSPRTETKGRNLRTF